MERSVTNFIGSIIQKDLSIDKIRVTNPLILFLISKKYDFEKKEYHRGDTSNITPYFRHIFTSRFLSLWCSVRATRDLASSHMKTPNVSEI